MAFNAKKFRPTVHACEVPFGDDKFEFYVREPSGREILEAAAADRAKKPALEHARELFAEFVVLDKDGAKLTPQDADDMLDMPFPLVMAVSDMVQEKIGIKKVNADKQADATKNA